MFRENTVGLRTKSKLGGSTPAKSAFKTGGGLRSGSGGG